MVSEPLNYLKDYDDISRDLNGSFGRFPYDVLNRRDGLLSLGLPVPESTEGEISKAPQQS
jgi:hypothetical protein